MTAPRSRKGGLAYPVRRFVYVSAGGANIIAAHRAWREGIDDASQVSVTFSSQVAQATTAAGAEALLLSFRDQAETLVDGPFTLRHLIGRHRGGVGYHLEEVRRAVVVLRVARRFGAEMLLIDSGALAWFTLPLFQKVGIVIVPILHNTLWPAGHPPTGSKARAIAALNRLFWQRHSGAVLAVSPEAGRQAQVLHGSHALTIVPFRPLFRELRFRNIPSPPALPGHRRILFVGRAVAEKGVLLLPAIAAHAESRQPGALHWTVCGDGRDLPALRAAVSAQGLDKQFDIRGWTAPAELRDLYAATDAVIVPTTSRFPEGLAMTAIEAVLAHRPVITNTVVPALELIEAAAVIARPDDPASHADAALSLLDDDLYATKQQATEQLGAPFYDERNGLACALIGLFGGANFVPPEERPDS